ncbi:hypothetical protein M408DRAFT_330708 [Serendipita vermifera MAFF 305830]|uniref:Uncharacterized protein n=1 Tax=Serendipita vermifera MAFF 305830 TaxID=933852 RepID=A0A0C2WIE3_SERVB|nr:hypothetical protein M408DRAFT_330708 [Serendipita vermifera MAFF 305830]
MSEVSPPNTGSVFAAPWAAQRISEDATNRGTSPTTNPSRDTPLPSGAMASRMAPASRVPSEYPPHYSGSVELTNWFRANRASITDEMEQRLVAAGYMPSNNPDDLTEEEWETKFGITKFELIRLREIYARDHQRKQ